MGNAVPCVLSLLVLTCLALTALVAHARYRGSIRRPRALLEDVLGGDAMDSTEDRDKAKRTSQGKGLVEDPALQGLVTWSGVDATRTGGKAADESKSKDKFEPISPKRILSVLHRDISSYISSLVRQRGSAGAKQLKHPPEVPQRGALDGSDVFVAVKTTSRFHTSRLSLLLDTWIGRAKEQTYIFTDEKDDELEDVMGDHVVVTNCAPAHSHQALSCKMEAEFEAYLVTDKQWFCHVDDDNYLNVPALLQLLGDQPRGRPLYLGRPSLDHPVQATDRHGQATLPVRFWFATGGAGFCINRELAVRMKPWVSGGAFVQTAARLRLPDDCTVGYIAQALLGVPLSRSSLFHSHLENLAQIPAHLLPHQVTLSYGTFDGRKNVVSTEGGFSAEEDPTRFRTMHCVLHPDTSWCSPVKL
uniref:beta-1,3-N-acetylglucosaminyltransferase manic fringe-like n=1 Tax=Myxine glutinosa TaxID=7769 RepID=UPI0035901C2E